MRRFVPAAVGLVAVGLVSAVAVTFIGNVNKTRCVQRSRWARDRLSEVARAQKEHARRHGRFTTDFAALAVPTSGPGSYVIGFSHPGTGITDSGFVIAAVGNPDVDMLEAMFADGDAELDIWTIDETGSLRSVTNDCLRVW